MELSRRKIERIILLKEDLFFQTLLSHHEQAFGLEGKRVNHFSLTVGWMKLHIQVHRLVS